MTDQIKAVVSIDFDWFVRERWEWDWGHRESPEFYELVWNIRYARLADWRTGKLLNVLEETDPKRWADIQPDELRYWLQRNGACFNARTKVVVADSHSYATDFIRGIDDRIDIIINIDAHHDVFTEPEDGKIDCGNWWVPLIDEMPDTRHLWIRPGWLESWDMGVRNIDTVSFAEYRPDPMLIVGLFICRSSCWVPPHLDPLCNEMIYTFTGERYALPERHFNVDEINALSKLMAEYDIINRAGIKDTR